MPQPARYRPATVAVEARIRQFIGRLAIPAMNLFELVVTPDFLEKLMAESPAIFRMPRRRLIADDRAGQHREGRVNLAFDPPFHSMAFVVDERQGVDAPDFKIQAAGTLRAELLSAHSSMVRDLQAVADGRQATLSSPIGSVPLSSLPPSERHRLETLVREAQARRNR